MHLSRFGRCRIDEVKWARHFSVGRTAARDLLLRLAGKDFRSRVSGWYALRWRFGPAALCVVIGVAPQEQAVA